MPATGTYTDIGATTNTAGTGTTTGQDAHPLNCLYARIPENQSIVLTVRETKASPMAALMAVRRGSTAGRVVAVVIGAEYSVTN